MTNKEAVNWLINLTADIGKSEHHDLWHYEQALYEIRDMLQSLEDKGTDVPSKNTISRTDAIELVKDVCDAIMSGCKSHYDSEVGEEVYDDILEVDAILKCNKKIRKALKGMPSAQPEHLVKESGGLVKDLVNDTISRQMAVKEAKELYDMGDCYCDRSSMIGMLNSLPSAQPETAKRIVGKSRDGMTLWYQCDMCNEPVDAQDDFCRGCGRRLIDE